MKFDLSLNNYLVSTSDEFDWWLKEFPTPKDAQEALLQIEECSERLYRNAKTLCDYEFELLALEHDKWMIYKVLEARKREEDKYGIEW